MSLFFPLYRCLPYLVTVSIIEFIEQPYHGIRLHWKCADNDDAKFATVLWTHFDI